MKKLFLSTIIVGFFALLPNNVFANTVGNENVTTNFMLKEQAEQIYNEVIQKQNKPFYDDNVVAYETDLEGNTVKVEPISRSFMLMAPPKDGFTYSPSGYTYSSGNINARFKSIGSFTLKNNSDVTISAQYEQQTSVTTNWSVSSSISGTAKFKASFLGSITANIGAGAAASKTTSKGTKISVSGTLAPKKSLNMNAYQKGGYSSGYLVWDKYSPSGSKVGTYKESTKGTAPVNGYTVDVTN